MPSGGCWPPLARGTTRSKTALLSEVLTGRFVDHHAFLLERMLHRVDALTAEIATVQSRIDARVAALADTVTPLDAIPGVAQSPRRRSWPRPGSTWAGSRPGRLDSAGDLHHLERLRPARAGADRG